MNMKENIMPIEKAVVIIPALNEGSTIGQVIRKIKELTCLDTIVIDDGSTDDTLLKSQNAGAEVISHPFNMGYGIALQTGYKYAYAKGYDFVIQMDGDGQHGPESIPDFLKELKEGEFDLILGSRFLSDSRYKVPCLRRLGIALFKAILLIFTHKKFTDPTSGYQAFNRKVLNLYLKDIFPHDYPDADMLLALYIAGIKIKEIPTKMYKNYQNKTMHSGFKPIYYMVKMLISIFITLLRPRGG